MSRATTRFSSRPQLQRGDSVAGASSTACWRGVGMTVLRQWLCGARQPP